MNLYLISQDKIKGYDVYDSAIVAATSVNRARLIHPSKNLPPWKDSTSWHWCTSWPTQPSYIQVDLLGEAKRKTSSGLILASFNAG